MENNKTAICQSCKKIFKLSELNKIRFGYDTVLLCNLCISKTDFVALKKSNKPIDVTFENPI